MIVVTIHVIFKPLATVAGNWFADLNGFLSLVFDPELLSLVI